MFRLLVLFITTCCAAPAHDPRDVDQRPIYTGYVQDPNGRGTFSLVLSCLLTLLLCVWSALHLNVPARDQTKVQYLWTNIRWIFIGIYAPELVCFVAWRQWSSATLLDHAIHQILATGEREENPNVTKKPPSLRPGASVMTKELPCNNRRYPWTRTHGFFASTGGFAIEHSPSAVQKDLLPKDCPNRLTLTAHGVMLLAECGQLPDIAVEDILDKSKANSMAKALVIIQALWMLLQVIGRVAAHLPVTLLEVNTIAHVFCALLMYALWWHKPLLPNEPILLSSPDLDALFAYMFLCSEVSGSGALDDIQDHTTVKRLFASMNVFSKTPEIESLCYVTTDEHDFVGPTQLKRSPTLCLEYQDILRRAKTGDLAFFERRPRIKASRIDPGEANDTPGSITTKTLAAMAVARYPSLRTAERLVRRQRGCSHVEAREYVVPRVRNWPSEDLLRQSGGLVVGMMMWASNLAYGAVHAAAWNDHFPSVIEKWLWRSSTVYIAFAGGLWIVLNGVAHLYPSLNDWWERWMDGEKGWWQNLMLGSSVIVCGASFILARMYIIVEAFISIRQLPMAAYDTPSWSQIFPHF